MKKIKNLVIGGIQQKVFNLVLYAILLVIAAYTIVIFYQASRLGRMTEETNDLQKQMITETTGQVVDESLTASLSDMTRMEAYIADDMFRDLTSTVEIMGEYAQKLYDTPEDYPVREVSLPDPEKDGEVTVQLLTSKGTDISDPVLAEQIALAANMSDLLVFLYKNSPVNACYIALPDGVMLLADDHPSSKYEEDGTLTPIGVIHRPWYTGAVRTGGVYITDVLADAFTGQIGVMCAMPVYRDGKLAAVVGADLYLDNMAQAVADTEEKDGYVCIVNERGHVIFSPKKEGIFQVREGAEAPDLRRHENEPLAAFIREALVEDVEPTVIEVDGVSCYLCGSPVSTTGWAVINVVSTEESAALTEQIRSQYDGIVDGALTEFNDNLNHARVTILVLLLIMTALALAAALILAKRIVRPLGLITERVQNLGGNHLQFMMEDAYRTGDEIEVLAESFATLSARTLRYVDQVKEVTAEKERIGAELNMATAIQASQLPRLFPPFPNRPEFDIYASMTPAREVGGDFYDFFLVDDDHLALVMADVSGKGVPAALFMMVSRVLIKTCLQEGRSPAETLRSVNEQLCEGNEIELFVTVWLAVLEFSTGKGVAANAGHEHPALCRAGGEFALQIYRHSPAVATVEGIRFREHPFALYPGDSLFVYTDGVTEAANAELELFGIDRMLDALNRNPAAGAKEVLENVSNDIEAFVAGAEQFDDITMLCLKYNGPQEKG